MCVLPTYIEPGGSAEVDIHVRRQCRQSSLRNSDSSSEGKQQRHRVDSWPLDFRGRLVKEATEQKRAKGRCIYIKKKNEADLRHKPCWTGTFMSY